MGWTIPELWILKCLEHSGRDLIQILSRNLPGGNERNHRFTGHITSYSTFEPDLHRLWVRWVTIRTVSKSYMRLEGLMYWKPLLAVLFCVVSKWLGIGLHLLHPALLKWRLQFPCISFSAVSSVTADRYVFNVISCSSQSEVDVNRHVHRIDC